ncbi:MAG: electron transfer flavoprotein subunit beta/FixA family protein [Candidatus Brockarchaeota archaeon]|nr:electron transfer flavoprotein subunit beta/FixA family protein [Candidatus Brockarchaeota archaeon]
MKIVVLIKQVPDITRVKFDAERGRIDRSSAEAEINPFDLNALEAAVQVKEKLGGTVVAISMGPQNAAVALRDALARGADEAILLEDNKFAGADTLATSYTLAGAIKKLGNFDIIFCGEKTVDGDTGQVGAEVAEFLQVPHLYYVSKVKEVKEDKIVVVSEMEEASYVVECEFPVLVSVTKDVNKPRLPTLREKLKAMKAEIKIWHAENLTDIINLSNVGYAGSPTVVSKVVVPKEKGREGKVFKEINEGIKVVLEELAKKGLI